MFDFAAASMIFALMGCFGLFYSTTIYDEIRRLGRQNRAHCLLFLVGGMILGILIGVAPHTSYLEPRRSSGLWQLGRLTPAVFDRSPLIVLLALIGGVVFAAVLAIASSRDRWVFALAFLLFTAAQCANPALFQRYYEPFVLMFLILATSRIPDRDRSVSGRWILAASGPLLLALLLAVNTFRLINTRL